MSRLSEDLDPALTPPVLNTLFSKSIYTSLSFIRVNTELLVKITGLSYKKILQIKDNILSKFSSKLRHGDRYYKEVLTQCAILPTGIENFDKLLDCGFITGNIYELCGFSGCGKTQICMTISANISLLTQQQVFYFDTKNDISGHRIFQILEEKKIQNVGEIMEKIQICRVRSAFELLKELHNLGEKIKRSQEKFLGFRLIIIDSLSALFQHFTNQSEGLSLLNNVADLLKYICVEYHMVVLLTNFVSSWTADLILSETESENDEGSAFQQVQTPALGKYWAHVPNFRIMVRRNDGSNDCFLIILKSPNQPAGKSVRVKISDAGVT